MKKIVAGLLFLFFAVQATAQINTIRNYGFRLGLTAYPTFGKISPEVGENKGTNLGFAYGLMADFNFAEHYSFNTGLTITTINGKSREINALPYHAVVSSTAPIAYDLKYKMQYLEIPFILKLRTSKIGDLKWFGQFGLSNGFKIRASQDAKTATGVLANDRNSGEWTRFYRAGLVIGGGGEFDLAGHTSLMAGISYNNGLTSITTSKNAVRNHFVSLNLGVFF
ncbi:porin family protein [Pedobacter sp. Du54]|uniref:porin family protein n=1 Tax=Pedobacter anseongensis TaxID=3133439 RepID=UPI0030A774EE